MTAWYDAIIAFRAERRYVWTARWSFTKALYLWTRIVHLFSTVLCVRERHLEVTLSAKGILQLMYMQDIWAPETCGHSHVAMTLMPFFVVSQQRSESCAS